MEIDNLHDECMKINLERWIIATKAILDALLLNGMTIFFSKEKTQEEFERRIANSSYLKRVDGFCTKLPKPEESKLLRKTLAGNSFTTSISYRYRLPMKSNDAFEFYEELFRQNEWIYADGGYESKDRKNRVTVV